MVDAGLGLLGSAIFFAVFGALIGLRYRAPALIPASVIAVLWAIVAGRVRHDGLGQIVAVVIILAVVLHVAYLIALALRTLADRSR